MHLFLNGVEVSSSPHSASFADIHPGGNLIGAWNAGDDQYRLETFKGRIRDFRVWGVARTEAQIRDNRFSLSAENQPDLIGQWNFDEVKDGKTKNRVTGSYDAQLMGKSRVVEVPDFGGRENLINIGYWIWTGTKVMSSCRRIFSPTGRSPGKVG